MGPLRSEPSFPPDTDSVGRWRASLLIDAGFGRHQADELARDPRYDLHAVLELVDRGCPAVTAARIAAPLHEELRQC